MRQIRIELSRDDFEIYAEDLSLCAGTVDLTGDAMLTLDQLVELIIELTDGKVEIYEREE